MKEKIPDKKDICNEIAQSFANNSSDSNYHQNFIINKRNQINSRTNQDKIQDPPNELEYLNSLNQKLSKDEIVHVLSKAGNTSPGPDDIPNDLLKNLPQSGIDYLTDLYNLIWTQHVIPNLWREAIVCPIPKPEKDHSKATNYRPISLTCNLCKILEKVIGNRLKWILEKEKIITPNQFSSRENLSTLDYLIKIETEACNAFANKGHLLVVSIDIEKAYEMVWKDRVIHLLEDAKISGNCLEFIKNF